MAFQDSITAAADAICDELLSQANAARERIKAAEAEALRLVSRAAPDELNYDDASKYLGCGRRTLEDLVAKKRITYRKQGGRVWFTRAALDEYRESHTVSRRLFKPLSL